MRKYERNYFFRMQFRISDLKTKNPTVVKVATGPLKKSMLDSNVK